MWSKVVDKHFDDDKAVDELMDLDFNLDVDRLVAKLGTKGGTCQELLTM